MKTVLAALLIALSTTSALADPASEPNLTAGALTVASYRGCLLAELSHAMGKRGSVKLKTFSGLSDACFNMMIKAAPDEEALRTPAVMNYMNRLRRDSVEPPLIRDLVKD